MEIVLARCAPDDARLVDVWERIDETAIPTGARRALLRNGFRAGVVGGTVPQTIAELFRLQSEPVPAEPPTQLLTLEEPAVKRHLQTYRSGRPGEITTSGPHERLPLLISDRAGLRGQTVADAQCVYVIRPTLLPGQQISLELTPEVHHGAAQTRYTADERFYRMDVSQQREILQELQTTIPLSPGQLLLLGGAVDRPGSLGDVFHSVITPEGPHTKLVLIRLAQVPPDS